MPALATSTAQAVPYGPPADCVIVEPGQRWAYTYCSTYTAGLRTLEKCRIEDPQRFALARLVLADRFSAEIEAEYVDEPISEITSERFFDMLNCMPPCDWTKAGGVERFNQSEMTYGCVTVQAAAFGDRYFSKYVRRGDHATYMTAASITDALAAGTVKPIVPELH